MTLGNSVPRRIWLFLAVGLVALSQSANIIRIGGDAPPIAIAAWRLGLATVFFAPLAGARLFSLFSLKKKEYLFLSIAGICLALHFFSWITAVQKTTVANATLFMSINPVLTSVGAYLLFGEKASPRLVFAIVLGIVGIVVLGGADFVLTPEHIFGDFLALVSSFFLTVYFMVAKRLRPLLDADVYVTAVYGIAALLCFLALLCSDCPLVKYDQSTWLCFVLMAIVPTMIGHTSLNTAFRYIDAGRVSALTVVEPCFAGVVAYFAWNESIGPFVFVGYALICGSVLIVALDRT